MSLDFRRAAALFVSTRRELAMALGCTEAELDRYITNPGDVPNHVLAAMGRVLIERGQGMARVGEMLSEQATGAEGNGTGA